MIPRALLRCAASPGTGPVLASLLASELSGAEHALADALGCLVPAAPSRIWPCDDEGHGCPRVVREDPHHALPLVAVCGREDDACEPVRLTHEQVARVRFDVAPLVRAIAGLLGVAGAEIATIGADVLTLLGPETRGGRARDVAFAPDPHDPALLHALAARAGAARPTLALTPVRGAPSLHDRFAAGGHVELTCLEDLVVLDGGALRLAGPAPEPTGATSARPRTMPRPASWSELRIYRIDGHTVSARTKGATARLTYVDLGMASTRTREPTKTWALLLALCEGGGTFRWKDQGAHATVKQRVAVLRKELSAVFGLDDDPFEPFSLRDGWRARFVARDGDGESLAGTRAERRLHRRPAVLPARPLTARSPLHQRSRPRRERSATVRAVPPDRSRAVPPSLHQRSRPPRERSATVRSVPPDRSRAVPPSLHQRSRPRRERSATVRPVPPDRSRAVPPPLHQRTRARRERSATVRAAVPVRRPCGPGPLAPRIASAARADARGTLSGKISRGSASKSYARRIFSFPCKHGHLHADPSVRRRASGKILPRGIRVVRTAAERVVREAAAPAHVRIEKRESP